VEIKCQLDATEVVIADLIACSTCFGHHYAHHQELKSIMHAVVAACGILCCGFSSSWSGVELRVMCPVCRMLCILQTGHITLSSTPDQLLEKPQHEIPQAATTV